MHRTTSSVGVAGGLSGAQKQAQLEPAWQSWLRLQELALKAAEDPAWESAVEPIAHPAPSVRSAGAPILHGATLRVNARRVRRLLRELLRTAAETDADGASSLGGLRARRLDALALLRAAVVRDDAEIERIAAAAAVEADALAVVAQLAVIPVLHVCARRLQGDIPSTWMRGYCPVCAAWPTLGELRGIERNRRLRCARCASDWPLPVLHCAFCGEVRHDNLGSLLLEGEEQTRRLDVCKTCNGYLKTFTVLRPMTLRSVAMMDLGSIELDLAAQERGYARPERAAFEMELTIEDARAGRAARAGAPAGPP